MEAVSPCSGIGGCWLLGSHVWPSFGVAYEARRRACASRRSSGILNLRGLVNSLVTRNFHGILTKRWALENGLGLRGRAGSQEFSTISRTRRR